MYRRILKYLTKCGYEPVLIKGIKAMPLINKKYTDKERAASGKFKLQDTGEVSA
jgi:hypothetical protein